MAPRTDFPPIRACLFDMDGLLLDTEDLYTLCINLLLAQYNKPNPLPWKIKAKLQGRPFPEANKIFHEWAQLPIPHEQYNAEIAALQKANFPSAQPLPGAAKVLSDLGRTRYWELAKEKAEGKQRVHIALATSSQQAAFALKTTHHAELFAVFESHRRVLGDDSRIPKGRGKPLPDIYLLALATINESLPEGEPPITPEECLVFEDSVPGVEAGRRAGMRVVWIPHPMLKKEVEGQEDLILAGRTGEAGQVDLHQLEGCEVDDGWAEYIPSLEELDYAKYGIEVPPKEVDQEECMKKSSNVAEVEVENVA